MSPHPRLIRIAIVLLLSTAASRVRAQQFLLAEDDGKMAVVRAAHGLYPCVEKDGKIVPITTRGFSFTRAPEFLPTFVSVTDVSVRTSYVTMGGEGQINNSFSFNADFESGFYLKDVFVVLDLRTEKAGHSIFVSEVGELRPHDKRSIGLTIPISKSLGSSNYHVHIYSEGMEVLQSLIPLKAREAALDRMVAKRTENAPASGPRFFVGPLPEYPAGPRKAGQSGEAVLSLTVASNGAVRDPTVTSATEKAFGEAALVAVRQWRFLPAVRDGRPVEATVNLPIEFTPPGSISKKS